MQKLLDGSEIMNAKMLFTSSRAESHVSAILLFIFMHKLNHSSVLIFSGFYPLFKCFEKQCIDNGLIFFFKRKI